MPTDNTVLNTGSGGDTVRDLARQAGNVKTQVVQLDIGGSSANAEVLVTAGQQTMAASLPVVFASDQTPFSITGVPARDNFGQALSAVSGTTITVASVVAVAGYRIKGMVCHGTGEGYFAIRTGLTTVLSGRIRASAPMLVITLPNGIATTVGAVVTLTVTNEAGATADYEATLLGE